MESEKTVTFSGLVCKQTTRAAIGTLLTEDGEARTVRASTRWDFISNVGRLSATRADNNAVLVYRRFISVPQPDHS